jgi:adenylosuccinate synthase
MGLDRLEHANTGVTDVDKLTPRARNFLDELELATGVRVEFAGTGFGTSDSIKIANNVRGVELSHV